MGSIQETLTLKSTHTCEWEGLGEDGQSGQLLDSQQAAPQVDAAQCAAQEDLVNSFRPNNRTNETPVCRLVTEIDK